MKYINAIFALLFFVSAALQFNDPDSLLWIGIYAALGVICVFCALGRIQRPALILAFIFLFVFMFNYFTSITEWYQSDSTETILQGMDRNKPYLEETREFFGLLIGFLIIGMNLFKKK